MLFSQFILKAKTLIQANVNSQTYFFTVNHITHEGGNTFIYGIQLNTDNYFLSKTRGVSDCVQLDARPPLTPFILSEIGDVVTEAELKFMKRPTLEQINSEIFRSLAKIRATLFRQ